MSKIIILLAFLTILIGINSGYFHDLPQKYIPISQSEQGKCNDFSDENSVHFLSENSEIVSIAGEKPSVSVRLYSAFRLLLITISLKEICFKQFFKNKLIIREIISNICLVKRLHAGYYTYGQGKIRL